MRRRSDISRPRYDLVDIYRCLALESISSPYQGGSPHDGQADCHCASKAAIEKYHKLNHDTDIGGMARASLKEDSWKLDIGSPVEHEDLIFVSQTLVKYCREESKDELAAPWRLETLLKGANVYQPPPPPKPEPVS